MNAETSDEKPRRDPFAEVSMEVGDRAELILVRHGQQVDVMERDSPLSELGRRQAAVVGEYLADVEIDAIWSSNLSRAHDTGLAIAAHHDIDCQVSEDLREVELGRDLPDGRTSRELLSDEELEAHADRFVSERRWDAFAFSESGEELRARVMPVIDRIVRDHPTGRVVVACHGGVINAIVGASLGVAADFFFRTGHCSLHRIRATPERSMVVTLNETHHLGDLSTH